MEGIKNYQKGVQHGTKEWHQIFPKQVALSPCHTQIRGQIDKTLNMRW